MKKYREHDFTNSILEEPLRRVFCLENDQKNLLEFIRRIREGGKWSVNGLTFFEVNPLVLLGNSISLQGCLTKETVEEQEKVKAAECQIQGLQESINHMKSFGDCEVLCQDLKRKNEECNKLMQTIKELRHSMKDEAASSHEKITQLKKKCQTLEERVTHAERQTSLREDIIQELKREINQLQHQVTKDEVIQLNGTIEQLQNTLQQTKRMQDEEEKDTNVEIIGLKERIACLTRNLRCSEENEKQLTEEVEHLNQVIQHLSSNLRHVEEKRDKEKKVCKICKGRSKVGFCQHAKVQVDAGGAQLEELQRRDEVIQMQSQILDELKCNLESIEDRNEIINEEQLKMEELNKALEKRDEIIRLQNETLASLQEELDRLKELEKQERLDKRRCVEEIKELKNEINELQSALGEQTAKSCALQRTLEEKNEIIAYKSETIHALQTEMEMLKSKLKELNLERERYLCEMKTFRDGTCKLQESVRIAEVKSTCVEAAVKEKDDIIKLQLDTINALQSELRLARNRNINLEADSEDLNAKLKEKDGLIQLQTHTLNQLLTEMETLKYQHKRIEAERQSYVGETERLKCTLKDKYELKADVDSLIQRESQMCSEVGCLKESINEMETSLTRAEQKVKEFQCAIEERDEMIRRKTEAMNSLEAELHAIREKSCSLECEKTQHLEEIKQLKNKINELKVFLEDAEGRANNLQSAVDLYMNTIDVLEKSNEKFKIEIDQQKSTITHLQEALVAAKKQMDITKPRTEGNQFEDADLMKSCISLLLDTGSEKEDLLNQYHDIFRNFYKLQDLNLDLEMEFCSSLQDVDALECQLVRYQGLVKNCEGERHKYKSEMKKLMKQKKCYKEVVVYFRDEMQLMAEQLQNLQELLTMSHGTVQEENSRLMDAFMNVKTMNEQLSTQLSAAEQKVMLENQMNQLYATKIADLERLVNEKEVDLGRHDQAIYNIRETLQSSLQQNEELHQTIVALNETIAQLQSAIQRYELDNCRSRQSTTQCQAQIDSCKDKLDGLKCALDEKTAELCKLEMAYNCQNRCLMSAQLELKEMKEKQKDKQCEMKCVIKQLKQRLEQAEKRHNDVEDERKKLHQQLCMEMRREAAKEEELKRYKNVIGDLKKTLVDLNKSLTKKNFKCSSAECQKMMGKDKSGAKAPDDVCLNCPCEVVFYQGIVETLKKTVVDLKTRLIETQSKAEQLEREKNEKETQQQEKEREYIRLRLLLDEKMKKAQMEEARYLELAGQFQKELSCIRRELELKTLQLDDVKKSCQEVNSSRCLQLACAEEEINNLKDDLNNLLRKHCALNVENEKLHSQSARMQETVVTLEHKSQLLTSQLEQYLTELQTVQTEKEALVQKNQELLTDLRNLQCSYNIIDKQQRYVAETAKKLQMELEKVKNSRDEICAESKVAIGYFRGWLQEQKKINRFIMKRERSYCETINKMKEDNENLQPCLKLASQKSCRFVDTPCKKNTSPPPRCHSSWSLGSQGTASARASPCTSPCLNDESCPNEDSDWYSSNFKIDSEEDEEEDWVSKVEDLAAQVRRSNKIWKTKMESADYAVCRDPNK